MQGNIIILPDSSTGSSIEITLNIPSGAAYRKFENAKSKFFRKEGLSEVSLFGLNPQQKQEIEINTEVLKKEIDDPEAQAVLEKIGFGEALQVYHGIKSLYYDESVFSAMCSCLANSTYRSSNTTESKQITQDALDNAELYPHVGIIMFRADFFFGKHFKTH
jgi:hypothetical protein